MAFETLDRRNPLLPPLPELLPQIELDVVGLDAPYLGLQLRGLHYGVEEGGDQIVGLALLYTQKYLGSDQVFAVESSLIPAVIAGRDAGARAEWSLPNLVSLWQAALQLHRVEPEEPAGEAVEDEQFERDLERLRALYWAPLNAPGDSPVLTGMEITRDSEGLILARRFRERQMILLLGLGLQPPQFLEAAKLLVVLKHQPDVVQRHQSEFERFNEEL